jgi:hypothetical protein
MFNPGLQHFLQTWKVKGDLVFVHVFDILHNSFPPPGVILFYTDQLLIPLQQFIFPMMKGLILMKTMSSEVPRTLHFSTTVQIHQVSPSQHT